MFWLPKLAVGAARWRLPLLESTAATIVAVLFPVAVVSSRVALPRAVAADPAFALWLACRFPRDRVPRGIDELADWFLQDPVSHLTWDEAPEDASPPAPWDPIDWSELAERSLHVARQVAPPTGESPRGGQHELLGLLHASAELLALCGPPVPLPTLALATDQAPAVAAGPSCLPDWLATAIAELRQTGSTSPISRGVREAVAAFAGGRPADRSAGRVTGHDAASTGLAALLPGMCRSLSRLASLENAFAAALESAKLDAMRELAYGASHEINNPLANISTRAQTLLVGETDPERRRKLATINSQAFRAHEMISDIMLFAKPPRIDPIPVDLAELAEEILSELADDAAEQGTELRCKLQREQISVLADRGHLAVALKSLVRNALEAIGLGGHVELTAARTIAESATPSQVEIVVQDTGPGVPVEVRDSIFNPFFSGREAGRGLGLGLSKCWRIITLHGGSISHDETYTAGARFVIRLPVGAAHAVDPEFAVHG